MSSGSITLKRLESQALRELALLFQNDAKNKSLKEINVTEVRITNDLSYMTVYFTCFNRNDKDTCMEALESSKGYIRSYLAKRLKARKMPDLIFKFDEALEYGNHINSILASLDIKHDEDDSE